MTPGASAWIARLAELAEAAAVPGAVLGVWADSALTVTPYGVLSKRTGVETTADSVLQTTPPSPSCFRESGSAAPTSPTGSPSGTC